MEPKIVVIGSANTDMVVRVDHIPEPGETILGGNFIQTQGGKGANQAVAAARLGANVTFIGRLGKDVFGDMSVAAYQKEGICTDFIFRDGTIPSGVALIMVDQHGENIIAVAMGANAELSPDDIHASESAIRSADYLLVQMEIPMETIVSAIQTAHQHRVPVILNPAPAQVLPESLTGLIDYLTPNQTEIFRLVKGTSGNDALAAARQVKAELGVKHLVITLGRKGAQITDDNTCLVPAFSVPSVDTTGAGDAFNGGLAVALARGQDLETAVRYASAVAALSTTCQGAQPSMPTKEMVEAFLSTKENS
jgi:ribokinase